MMMQLVHATGKTWYKVLNQHTMYVIRLANISIKEKNDDVVSSCNRQDLVQSLVPAHYVYNKFI